MSHSRMNITALLLVMPCLATAAKRANLTSFNVYEGSPGQPVRVVVQMFNPGPEAWTTNDMLVSTRPVRNVNWGVSQVSLTSQINPGQTFTFSFNATAPATAGQHGMGWQMWSSGGSPNQAVFGQEAYRVINQVPSQFIAKLYTEALGRIPDQAGWISKVAEFQNSMTWATARSIARAVLVSPEFTGRPYDAEARIIALYRTVLSRDPDNAGFQAHVADLTRTTNPVPWAEKVDGFLNGVEFTQQPIFNGGSYRWRQGTNPNYLPRVTYPTNPAGCNRLFRPDQGQNLQNILTAQANAGGGTVCLAQKEVVRLTSTLTIPSSVTLQTVNAANLAREHYALFGRLIRSTAMDRTQLLILIEGTGAMENVWIDGQEMAVGRQITSGANLSGPNIQMNGNGHVRQCKLADSPGWTNILLPNGFSGATIRDNVITAYTSRHAGAGPGTWTDGVSCQSRGALVEGNHVIDATDVPLVLFGNSVGAQTSRVRNNIILNAGNSAYGGLGIDQGELVGGPIVRRSFDNPTANNFEGNTLWTAPNVHYDIGLALGTRPWFGVNMHTGDLAKVRNNTTGNLSINCNIAIAVNNFNRTTVQGNTINANLVKVDDFPLLHTVVQTDNVSPTSGIQTFTPVTNAQMDGFIGH